MVDLILKNKMKLFTEQNKKDVLLLDKK